MAAGLSTLLHPGRIRDPIWDLLTTSLDAHQERSCVCRHCGEDILVHKRLDRAVSHLRQCEAFLGSFGPGDPKPEFLLSKGKMEEQRVLFPVIRTNLGSLEAKQLWTSLMLFVATSGVSFRAMENEHLKAAFRVCVPEVLLPTRKDFSGDLLTTVSCEISEKILPVWRNTSGFACLISDGYTNISSEPVLNYLSVCEGISFLF